MYVVMYVMYGMCGMYGYVCVWYVWYGMVWYGMVLCCPASSSSTSISWVERDRTHGFCGRQKIKPFPMLTCQETSLCYLACKNWKNCQKTIDLSSLVTTASGNSDLFPDSVSQRWPAVKEEKWGGASRNEWSMSCDWPCAASAGLNWL